MSIKITRFPGKKAAKKRILVIPRQVKVGIPREVKLGLAHHYFPENPYVVPHLSNSKYGLILSKKLVDPFDNHIPKGMGVAGSSGGPLMINLRPRLILPDLPSLSIIRLKDEPYPILVIKALKFYIKLLIQRIKNYLFLKW
ncbi:MAG: hypothetical protein V3T21_00450 [Candidatus Margulisiibacteriota bacterium]